MMLLTRRHFLRAVPAAVLMAAGLLAAVSTGAQEEKESVLEADEQTAEPSPQSAQGQPSSVVAAPSVFDPSKVTLYSDIPDFGDGPFTDLKEYDFSDRWGHAGKYVGSEFVITKLAKPGHFSASRRLEGLHFTDFKAELSFRFLSNPTSSHQFAGFHFGFRPSENAIQGFFMVRPMGGPREGPGQGQGDIYLMYQKTIEVTGVATTNSFTLIL